ncbi:hypothetical protein GH789_12490 [Rhizobium pusense]|uniref:hypothetical protein n=1 Tax=Agrobacterium pusense TaxID=648995 RepID=UPI00129AE205|nr:hypothetical protein [Agrobacterium pusense]MRG66095.1 hypothetical protein [Agrobacterium pusense]
MPRNGSGVYSKPAGTTAVPNTTIESAKFNQVVDDIAQDLNYPRPLTAGGTGATSAANARANLGIPDSVVTGAAFRGGLSGLTLSNNATDPTNDLDIAAGAAASDGTIPAVMALNAALTKRLDAAWAVGSGNGGLDTGSIANGTYHIWLIQRSDTGVVDALFSASSSLPTMPANYDRKRRIGSIIRTAGAIRGFYQSGDRFELSPLAVDVAAVNPGTTSVLRTLTVPSGIVVTANVTLQAENSGTGVFFAAGLFCPQVTPLPSMLQIKNIRNSAGSVFDGIVPVSVVTNNLSQIYSFCAASDASCTLTIRTLGWIDTRGQ